MMKNLQNLKLYPILIFGLLVSLIIYDVYATSTGRATRTSTTSDGCGSPTTGCHGNGRNLSTSLSLTGNLNVQANSVNNYTISVQNANRERAGINVAVKTTITGDEDGGTLTEGSGMKKILGEIAHDSPKEMSGGKADFSFTWTAPSLPGIYYLRAVGNAVDNNNAASNNDYWNWMEPQQITVVGVALTAPVGGENLCAGSAYSIKWKAAGFTGLKIELSADGGANYNTTLNSNFDPSGGAWVWNVPSDIFQGTNYKIRISDVNDPSKFSVSTNTFSIFGPFSIKKHPVSTDICIGEDLTLSAEIQGNGVSYQWRRNGTPIQGANSSTFTISNANPANSGFYGCLITSPCGSAQVTNDAEVNVRALTEIKTQPKSRAACKGEDISFEVTAVGQNVKYQWFKDGAYLENDTLPKLTINDVDTKNLGKYWVVVSGFCKPELKSTEVTLSMNSAPAITTQPVDKIACEKTKLEVTIASSGQELKYQWRKAGQDLPKDTLAKLTINSLATTDAGVYDCVVKNNCGTATTEEFTITVNPLPKITKQPTSVKIMDGSNAVFEVEASNVESYQWRKNNQNISDETNSKLVVFGITPSDAGSYDCVIKNACGTVTSNKATLTVDKPTPGPRVQFNDMKLNFGNVINKRSKDTLLTQFIRNNGTDTLKIKQINIGGINAVDFKTTNFETEIAVLKDSTLDWNFAFNPSEINLREAFVEIVSNSVTNPDTINVEGFGAFFDIRPNMKTLDFFDVMVDDSSKLMLRLTNLGNYTEKITKLELAEDNGVFEIEPAELVPDKDFIEIPVWFKPNEIKEEKTQLKVTFKLADTTIVVNLHGNGIVNSVIERFSENSVKVYPNPSSKNTIIKIENEEIHNFELIIYTIKGEKVREFSIADLQADNTIIWDGMNSQQNKTASGTYIGLLKINNEIGTINIILE